MISKQNMLLIYLTFFCHLSPVGGSLAATHLMMTHVGPCEDGPRAILALSELSITTQTYDSTLTGDFNITEDVENGWTIKATMLKCQDIRNTDTCDHFNSFRIVSDGCADDEAEEMYSMLFHYVSPLLECPVRAGVYKLTNYPFFSEDNYLTVSESKISTSVFGYTFQLDGFTVDGRKLMCVEAYLQLLYVREHDWIGNKSKQTAATPKVNEDNEK